MDGGAVLRPPNHCQELPEINNPVGELGRETTIHHIRDNEMCKKRDAGRASGGKEGGEWILGGEPQRAKRSQ